MVGYDDFVLLVVTSLAGPVTELFTPGIITEEARTKKRQPEGGPLFGRMRLDDCVKLPKRRLFGAVTLRKQCLGTFRRIESFFDRFKA